MTGAVKEDREGMLRAKPSLFAAQKNQEVSGLNDPLT